MKQNLNILQVDSPAFSRMYVFSDRSETRMVRLLAYTLSNLVSFAVSEKDVALHRWDGKKKHPPSPKNRTRATPKNPKATPSNLHPT